MAGLDKCVVGWRAWRVVGRRGELRLASVLRDDVWQPGRPFEAGCEHGHEAPEPGCGCGAYGSRLATVALRYVVGRDDPWVVHRVVGEVALWGRVVEGGLGWRAGLAYPVRIWVPRGRSDVVEGLRSYGVPVALEPGMASASPPRPDSFAR